MTDFLDSLDALDLSAEKRTLVAQLLQQQGEAFNTFPLSFAQQRLWFLDQWAPGAAAYHILGTLHVIGSLDYAALQRSLHALVQRHEALRTTFAAVDGQPIQLIQPPDPAPALPLLDMQALPAAAQASLQQALEWQVGRRPFELARGPLLRTVLLQLAATEHVLLLCMHHIVADGWSLDLFLRELVALYEALAQGRPVTLPVLPIQYADFAIWQREWLQGDIMNGQLTYWREQLAGMPPLLELPTDRPRPLTPSFDGARHPLLFNRSCAAALAVLSQRSGVTLFMMALAAFQTLLHRYTGRTDLVIGTAIAGRTRAEVAGLIGCFVNTLVLRVDLAGDTTFLELLQRVRASCLAAYEHQDLPFELLVEALQPARDLGQMPLVQVVFTLHPTALPTLVAGGVTLQPRAITNGTAKLDLTFELIETRDGLEGWLEYSADLFDATTIARMADHLNTLVDGLIANPNQRLSDLPLLTMAERHQLLVAWNATTAERSAACLHELVAAQAAHTPDAVAVVYETKDERRRTNGADSSFSLQPSAFSLQPSAFSLQPSAFSLQMTYAELNRRADQLASYLRTLGVGPEVPVGVCVERSLELLIALLGVLKAGGAYLPLDPSYPAARIAFMLEDAGAALLITTNLQDKDTRRQGDKERGRHGEKETRRKGDTEIDTLPVSLSPGLRVSRTVVERPRATASSAVAPSNLAYVIYTSGSTGTPKGVPITHEAVVNLLAALRQRPGLSAQDVLLAVTTVAFDIAALELFLPLTVGARLVLAGGELAADGGALAATLATERVSVMQATPATWRLLLAAGWAGQPRLRIFCGGEALPPDLAAQLRGRCAALWNMYGPTETTIWSAAARVADGAITIGGPIANTQLYVLDGLLRPTPIGVPGELFIGGAGLARGYVKRPGLTAERFVPNPFAEMSGIGYRVLGAEPSDTRHPTPDTRLYRTGDRARYRPDGMITYLGRLDRQLKLRGYRIEPDEIAAVLAQHPAVRASVIVARVDASGEPQLVAYIVPAQAVETQYIASVRRADDPASLTPDPRSLISDLRAFLSEQLPAYMLPATFVLLAALPLTANGKLDVAALPAPDWAPREQAAAFVAARTPVEYRLATIWAELLGRERVGIHDNFFESGGHSLLATQLLARIRDAFQVELPLRTFFAAPTIAGVTEQIATERRMNPVPALIIRPTERAGNLPLSFAQQRLWFLDQLVANSPLYTIPAAIMLTGALDITALERSLNEVVRRHEVLRTTFVAHDGQPIQQIAATLTLQLPVCDLADYPTEQQQAAGLSRIADEVQRPFDLARGPLVRGLLLRLGQAEHMLLLNMHHIVSDGWSMTILVRELATLYAAFTNGRASPLNELSIQYADYAVWQRQWLQASADQPSPLQEQLAYWRAQLADAPPTLDLPTDRPRLAVQTFHGATHELVIPAPLTAALTALSQRANLTLFMTLLAVFQTLLARYSAQDDIVVGAPIAGRTHTQVEPLIGCFVNTLALRSDLAGNPPFRELLGQVRQVTLAAYAHQDLPFELLVEALQPVRDLSRTPIFQVLFVLQNLPTVALDLPGLQIRPLPIRRETAMFDLSLMIEEDAAGLHGALEYATDCFDDATIRRMRAHFLTLLAGVVADPSRRIAELPLLSVAEYTQLLVEWNAPASIPGADEGVHELFAAQAARASDAVALVDGAAHLTYGTLERRANQLAQHLLTCGVRAETRVGLYTTRSLEQFVGLLGVLKAGGAYVPLDPSYPPERLAFIIADAQVSVLLVVTMDDGRWTMDEGGVRPVVVRLSSFVGNVVDLHADWPLIAQEPAIAPRVPVRGGNLAYVIYTSGSTGVPKGVLVAHAALRNYTLAMSANYALMPRDRLLQFAALSFDVSAEEIYPSLVCGATLVLRNERMLETPARFCRTCRDWALTVLNLPTAYWHTLVVELGRADVTLPTTRLLIIGGERALPEWLARWRAYAPQVQLVNTYGPTEATIAATMQALGPLTAGALPGGVVPIGRAIQGAQTYIVDRQMQLVPIGVLGELLLGGVGVARGYAGRPDLTAERFVPNPFAEVSGIGYRVLGAEPSDTRHPTPDTRLYRTGDLARYRPDGVIEFLGRIDHQVKLRGFRIELDEIAAVLVQHPSVRECVVIVREAGAGDMRLVAYVVPTADEGRTTKDEGADSSFVVRPSSFAQELRAFLQARLPDYMLPSSFVLLEALPLTPGGKLDRRALPPPEQAPPDASERFVAPRTPVEQALADIWAELFSRQAISINDNFFALGGHSLLSTQVISRVYDRYQIELPLRDLFEAPTVAGLAARVETMLSAQPNADAPRLRPVGRDTPLPLSFAQQRLWFLDQWSPGSAAYHLPGTLTLHGPLGYGALLRSLHALVARHEILRTSLPLLNGQPVQRIAASAALPLPLLDLQSLPAAARAALLLTLAQDCATRPFDLANGPLLRLALLRRDPHTHVLLLCLHHSIADGWSLELFLRELTALYSAFVVGRPSPLPELPIQYADFAVWRRAWLSGARREEQLAYWTGQLAGAPHLLALPNDYARPPQPTFAGARAPFALDPATTAALAALAQRAGATLFMTVLAAFVTLLARLSGQTDLLVGAPVAGRTQRALEGLLGCFVNTLVLRGELADNPPFEVLLSRVRQTCLDAYAHQELPFEQLVEALAPLRDPRVPPLVQVVLTWQSAALMTLTAGELTLLPQELSSGVTKFDLTLDLVETAGGVSGVLEYATELFAPTTIARVLGQFHTLLAGIVAQPQQRIDRLELLSAVERQQALVEWNTHIVAAPRDGGLSARLQAEAARTPDALAVVCAGQALSYGVLYERAGQLAQYLQTQGVGPDVRVGLCVTRSVELLIGMLGILLAGAAYVPLDPDYPPARLAFMIKDAGVRVLLTDVTDEGRRTMDDLAAADTPIVNRQSKIVNLSADWPTIAQAVATPPLDAADPAQLAYVIYTSGSTGQPKGVLVTRGGLLTLCDGLRACFADDEVQQVGLLTSISFDISVNQIFPTLLNGRTLHIIPDAVKYEPAALLRELWQQQLHLLDGVPSYMQLLLDADNRPARRLALRYLLLGGEPLSRRLLRRIWTQLGAQLVVVNIYGLTEASDVNAFGWLRSTDAEAASDTAVAIGRPLRDNQVYVLNGQYELQPVGVVGELAIAGASLARGYQGRPDLTAARFIPNPFAEVSGIGYQVLGAEPSDTRYPTPGTRLCRTGDLGRWQADGTLVVLGRIDRQVKLRGYRIEVGEIEAVLAQHALVRECAVLLRQDADGADGLADAALAQLVAYVVPSADEGRTTNDEEADSSFVIRHSSFVSELRSFLQARLPAYMLPATFVLLDSLPRTPNGKIDRQALPAPAGAAQAAQYVAPRTAVEAVLAQIWAQTLQVSQVGVTDSFFALGGHSLLAVQLVTQMRVVFQVNLPVRGLFEAITVAEMANLIIAHEAKPGQSDKIARLLQRLEAMSAEETRTLLAQKEQETSAE